MYSILYDVTTVMTHGPVCPVPFSLGNICSYIRCVDVEYESKREEEYYDVQVTPLSFRSICLSCQSVCHCV